MIDLKKIVTLYKGDRRKILKVLRIYACILPEHYSSLETAYEEQNVKKMQAMAHTLKTSFSYLSQGPLSNIAKELEDTCEKSDDFQIITPLFKQVIHNRVDLLDALHTLIAEYEQENNNTTH